MTYSQWFESHAERHGEIVDKLLAKGYDKAAIIDYFDFDNMVTAEPDFCPLYAEKKKCHDMKHLNCYLCACPYFRFNDDGIDALERTKGNEQRGSGKREAGSGGLTVYSFCAIDAVDGKQAVFGDTVHQDCSKCLLPHRRGFIEKHFDTDWKTIMAACPD